MREWVGPRYDPERFDLKLVNDTLRLFRATTPKNKR